LAQDVLEQILSAALEEKAIAQDKVAAFAAGLRDRARLILEERLRPVQDRVETLEKENAWRASAIQSLTDENARVSDENRRVKGENDRVKDEMRRLKDESQRVKDENARVREEHARLQDEVLRLKDESRRVQDECLRLKEEMEGVRLEWRTATLAHDTLLEHHRGVMRRTAESLVAVSALPFWKRGEARARLASLEAALRRDTA
jgi:chromosome segregation ATPase